MSLFALRRIVLVAALAAASSAFIVGGFPGTPANAGATTTVTGSISAPSVLPPVPSTGSGTGGSLTITLGPTGSLATDTLALKATSSAGVGYVHWTPTHYHVTVSTASLTSYGASGSFLDIVLGGKAANTTATISVTQIKFLTTGAGGKVVVTPRMTYVTFSPSSVSDAIVVQTPPNAPTMALAAASQKDVSPGTAAAVAGTWTLTISGDLAAGSGWLADSVLTISVAPSSGTNCEGGDYVYFVGTPTATLESSIGISETPSISPALANSRVCSVTKPDELKLTFGNAAYFDTSSQGSVKITISVIHYSIGTSASTGDVLVAASFASPSSSASPSPVGSTGASNASVMAAPTQPGTRRPAQSPPPSQSRQSSQSSGSSQPTPSPQPSRGPLRVSADTPPVTVHEDAHDVQISPLRVLESSTTHVSVGYVCLTITGAGFDAAVTPSVGVAAGNGTVGTVRYQGGTGTIAPTVEFQVTKASTTTGAYMVSGLAVDTYTAIGPVRISVTYGSSQSCSGDSTSIGSVTAFAVVGAPVTRVYGATPVTTGVAELEHQFDAEGTACPGRKGARPVVLATDASYPDALVGAYLASSLGTGELLTPARSLPAATADAIRTEGITQVYIVGNQGAVSTEVSQELEATVAYNCGGTTPLTSAGPVHIEVVRIAGATPYETAQWVAEYPPSVDVGSLDVSGAYGGRNPRGGLGRYNDTAGNASPAPGVSATLPTAIVATGKSFQDAEAAAVLSYADRLPILLTTPTALSPQVSSVISSLGIKQVIVMGGPLAVSDKVVSSLELLGVSVLRIAGHDAMDTAVQLADFELGSQAGHLGAGWTGTGRIAVARGDSFTDALAGAIVAAGGGVTNEHAPEPLLLCEGPSTVGSYLAAFLTEAGRTGVGGNAADRVTSLTVLGGPRAVTPSAVTKMTGEL